MLLTLLQSGGAPIDHQPVAVADSYSATQDLALVVPAPGVLTNDTGLQDGGLVLTVIGAVTGGSVILANDGSFTFTPTPGFSGPASFTYRVTDVDGDWAEALVSITVAAASLPTWTTGGTGGGLGHRRPRQRREWARHNADAESIIRAHQYRIKEDDRDVLSLLEHFLMAMED